MEEQWTVEKEVFCSGQGIYLFLGLFSNWTLPATLLEHANMQQTRNHTRRIFIYPFVDLSI